jgi:hypothetical protein
VGALAAPSLKISPYFFVKSPQMLLLTEKINNVKIQVAKNLGRIKLLNANFKPKCNKPTGGFAVLI